MVTKRNKTYSAKASELDPLWHVFDASGRPLGRLAVEIARILQGKHKPTYTPHMLTGDFVVVVNASQVVVTGNKRQQKVYYRHSGYPGGLKEITFDKMMEKSPKRAVELAVKGMLPRNALARHMLQRMKVYAGAEHPHEAQVVGSQKKQAATTRSQQLEK